MSQILAFVADSSCDLLSLDGVDLSAFRSPFALRRRNFAMTPGSTSTRWSRRSARPRGALQRLPECCRLGKSLRREWGCSRLYDHEQPLRQLQRRVRGKAELRGARPLPPHPRRGYARRGRRRCCCWKKAASAQRDGASFDEVCRVVEELRRRTHLLFSLSRCTISRRTGASASSRRRRRACFGIRAVGQASAEGTLEMLGKCRGERKTQEFLLQEMERLGYKGGSVRIGHCGNAAFSLELYTEPAAAFPNADVRRYPLRACAATMPSAAAS